MSTRSSDRITNGKNLPPIPPFPFKSADPGRNPALRPTGVDDITCVESFVTGAATYGVKELSHVAEEDGQPTDMQQDVHILATELQDTLVTAEVDVDRAEKASAMLGANTLMKEPMDAAEKAAAKAPDRLGAAAMAIEQGKKGGPASDQDEVQKLEAPLTVLQENLMMFEGTSHAAQERDDCENLMPTAAEDHDKDDHYFTGKAETDVDKAEEAVAMLGANTLTKEPIAALDKAVANASHHLGAAESTTELRKISAPTMD